MSKRENKTNVWMCEPCNFVFQTYGKSEKRARQGYFCPNCGENITVVRYKADRVNKKRKGKPRVYQFWTEEELEVVKKVLNGDLMIYQAAVQLGRSSKSVRRRLDRMKEEVKQI